MSPDVSKADDAMDRLDRMAGGVPEDAVLVCERCGRSDAMATAPGELSCQHCWVEYPNSRMVQRIEDQ